MSTRRQDSKRKGRASGSQAPLDLAPIVSAPWWHWWLAALLVAAAAVVVYLPTVDNDFITWDDPDYLTKNDYVAESGGLSRIWDPSEDHQQYYPLVFSSFWLEHKLVLKMRGEEAKESVKGISPAKRGFEPWIFHLTNLILHALNAALLVWVLRLLGVKPWVAWLTAGLFALHPINVASVSWAAERKNVLSGLFFLLALGFYLRDTRRPGWPNYVLCMLLFVCALFSKTATVTFPAAAVLCDRLIHGRWVIPSRIMRIAPMLVLGLAAAYITSTTERGNAGSTMVVLDAWLRPQVAAGAIWFYIGKVFLPANYPGVYPRWDLMGSQLTFLLTLLGLVALPALGYGAWKLRRRVSAFALWGAGFYVLSLSPMLGLIPFNYTQFSFVADHFVYLPCIGVFLALATGADWLAARAGAFRSGRLPLTVLGCLVLTTLGYISLRQNKYVWKDAETFWVYTLDRNEACWGGQYNLGNLYTREVPRLIREGKPEEAKKKRRMAIDRYALAVKHKRTLHQALNLRAGQLSDLGEYPEAAADFRQAANIVSERKGAGARNVEGRYRTGAAYALVQANRGDEAEPEVRKAITLLGKLWQRVKDRPNSTLMPSVRDNFARAHFTLGLVHSGRQEWGQAIAAYDAALKVNPRLLVARRARTDAQRQQAAQTGRGADIPAGAARQAGSSGL